MKHITIGRQYGSGGRDIGKRLSEKLKIPYYDNELIQIASDRSGLSREDIESLDERGRANVLQTLFSNGLPVPTTMHYPPIGSDMPYYFSITTSDQLFALQRDIIKELSKKGSAIFIGRCADYILKDQDSLDIFIHAPLDNRVGKLCDKYDIDINEAKKRVKKIDKKRRSYYNYFTDKLWSDVESYHLTIDSSKFDEDVIVNMVAEAYKKCNCKGE